MSTPRNFPLEKPNFESRLERENMCRKGPKKPYVVTKVTASYARAAVGNTKKCKLTFGTAAGNMRNASQDFEQRRDARNQPPKSNIG